MTKRYITDLTLRDLEEVFNTNSQIQQMVSEDMEESELHFIEEKLEYVRDGLSDWNIGLGSHSYMTVRSYEEFMEGIESMERNVPAFIEADKETLQEASNAVHDYMNTDIDSEEFSNIEDRVERLVKDVADLLVMRLVKDLESTLDYANQLDYFLGFYVDARMEAEDYYIKEGDFTLYRDIRVTESYK